MRQPSFRWKQIPYLIVKLSVTQANNQLLPILLKKAVRKSSRWLFGTIAVMVMLCWNWKLVIATGIGIGAMLLVYAMQGWNWQLYYARCLKFFRGSQGKLTLAVGGGGLAAFSTYLAASIWADSENRWIATGSLLQGFGTLLTLFLLLWHMIGDKNHRNEAQFGQLVRDLSDSNPVKRLIAVRQLTELIRQSDGETSDREQIHEYFCLMLATESEPVIREAVLDSLQQWERKPLKNLSHQSLKMPIDLL